MNHTDAAQVIGSRDTSDPSALNFADFTETCWGCLLADQGTGPCKQNKGTATLPQLTPGTLVHVEPGPNPGNIPTGTGIVVESYGDNMVVVWLWPDGAPIPGKNAHAYYAAEITPLRNTLLTIPPTTFAILAERAREAAPLPGFLQLAAAVEQAQTQR